MITRADLKPLRDSIEEARVILSTAPLAGRALQAKELIETAVKQADALIERPTWAMQAKRAHTRAFLRG